MTFPKFIICMDGIFRLGMVNQHKHLLKSGDKYKQKGNSIAEVPQSPLSRHI